MGAILIETYLLQTMNFHSLIATKATRVTGLNTHTPRSVMEFGTRRAQGESAGNDGAYAAVLGGCIGTANCLAEMKYGSEVKAVGTVAHSFIEFFPTEFDAFKPRRYLPGFRQPAAGYLQHHGERSAQPHQARRLPH